MTRYHWILTIQSGGTPTTLSGDWSVKPHDTHTSVYLGIYDQVTQYTNLPNAVVLFFSLEPDQLGGAG